MAEQRSMNVEVAGRVVTGELHLPEAASREQRVPAILACGDALDPSAGRATLLEDLARDGPAAGLAVALVEHARPREAGPASAEDAVDVLSAAFRQIALQSEVDVSRVGVLGHASGALLAACLAGRTDQVARLCLIAPPTTESLRSYLTRQRKQANGDEPAGAQAPSALLESITALDPLEQIAIHDRPTLILHGAADQVTPPEAPQAYVEALEAARRPVEHFLIALADHVFTVRESRQACVDRVLGFFSTMPELVSTVHSSATR